MSETWRGGWWVCGCVFEQQGGGGAARGLSGAKTGVNQQKTETVQGGQRSLLTRQKPIPETGFPQEHPEREPSAGFTQNHNRLLCCCSGLEDDFWKNESDPNRTNTFSGERPL